MSLELDTVIDDKYRIVKLLGEGGMGAVYEGENTRIHRRVAIKILHSAVASSEEAVQRFEREAQAAGRIGSEHIVEVLDLGILPSGDRYMVMEYLDGEALSDRIESAGEVEPRAAAAIVIDLLEGLRAAHEAGIIHRDLKPDNVFLLKNKSGKRDFVKIVDFGISKFNALGNEFSMTRTGAVMGTPYYMAPEQAKGGKGVDLRADLYAVGVVLYQAVSGRVPFDGDTFNELLFKIVMESPPCLTEVVPGIDKDFVAIVNRAMAREPDARFQTADEFRDALQRWLAGQPIAFSETAVAGTPGLDATVAHDSGGSTQGAWARTSGGEEPAVEGVPKKSNKGLLIGGVAAALVAAAALTFVLIPSGPSEEEVAAAAAAAEEEAERKAEAEAKRQAELDALKEEQAKAAEAAKKAADAVDKIEAEREALANEKRAAADAAAADEAAKEAAAKEAAARRAAARKSSSSTAKKPATTNSSGTAAGRTIRTEL